MLRTAPNFSNGSSKVPAHSLRHQTSASFAGFHTTHHSPAAACSLWGSPGESITECSRVLQLKDENVWLLLHGNAIKVHMCLAYQFITVIIESWQGKERNWAFLTALGNRLVRASSQWANCCRRVVSCKAICKASRCLMPRTMCWDPVCTVAEVWCFSEHYLWLWVAFWWQLFVGGIDCSVLLLCSLFWGC